MKNILESKFLNEYCATAANMYRLGWDERNGGNISYLLTEEEVSEVLDTNKVIRLIPLGFDATELAGKYFLVSGTGKYFKNFVGDPENNVGVFRISADGQNAELLCAEGGSRTHMKLPSRDFESLASAIPPLRHVKY